MAEAFTLILTAMLVMVFLLLLLLWLTKILLKRGGSRIETGAYKKDRAYNALKFTEKILEQSKANYEAKRECYEKLRSAKNAYERGQYTIAIELTEDIKSVLRRNFHGDRHRR
ncbi:MAG: hypothetical protein ACP5JR_03100 [Thermoplasmata archaeon]